MIQLDQMTPAERARENLRALIDRLVMSQREFAERVGKSQPWLQKILDGENQLRLDDLDQVARVLGVPTAELIRAGDDMLVEVTPTELRALRALRALDPALSDQVLAVLDRLAHKTTVSDKLRHQRIPKAGITPRVDAEVPPYDRAVSPVARLRSLVLDLTDTLAALERGEQAGTPTGTEPSSS